MSKNEKRQENVSDILRSVSEEFCDKYCKYPEIAEKEGLEDDELYEFYESVCEDCPCGRLA